LYPSSYGWSVAPTRIVARTDARGDPVTRLSAHA
jgi:hypothetical protein